MWFKKQILKQRSLLDLYPAIVLWEPEDVLYLNNSRAIHMDRFFLGITDDDQIVYRKQDGQINSVRFESKKIGDDADYGFYTDFGLIINESFRTRNLLSKINNSKVMYQIKEIRKQLDPMIETSEFDKQIGVQHE